MRSLIICCDGTANVPGQMDRDRITPSNVVKLVRSLKKNKRQKIYYDIGLGTGSFIEKIGEGITGGGISQNIVEAYRFLAKNYKAGDEIFCFGFSRGAYTVRSLCGMIHTCGLLKNDFSSTGYQMINQIADAYIQSFPPKGSTGRDITIANKFKDKCHENVQIKFLGVWDTVGALGVPLFRNAFSNLTSYHNISHFKETVRNAFHAVALDEFRKDFNVDLFDKEGVGRLKQMWFAGSHSNIGGGYVDTGLSDIALEWMIEHASKFGLEFKPNYREENNISPNYYGELRNSKTSFYNIFPDFVRKGNEEFTDENVHESVIKRIRDNTNNYKPRQDMDRLLEYHNEYISDSSLIESPEVEISNFYFFDPIRNLSGKNSVVRRQAKHLFEMYESYKQHKTITHTETSYVIAIKRFVRSLAISLITTWLILSYTFIISDWGYGDKWVSLKANVLIPTGTFVFYCIICPLLILLALIVLYGAGLSLYLAIPKMIQFIRNKISYEKS